MLGVSRVSCLSGFPFLAKTILSAVVRRFFFQFLDSISQLGSSLKIQLLRCSQHFNW
jgi:hypothetical protein